MEEGGRRPWYSYALTLAVLAALLFHIGSNVMEISDYEFAFRWLPLAGAFLSALAGLIVMFLAWQRLSSSFGLHAPGRIAARAYYMSQLGKYVPGKVGLVLVRMDAYRGYPRRMVALATGVEYILSFISACVLVLLSAVLTDIGVPSAVKLISACCLILLLVMLWPPLLRAVSNAVLRLFKRKPVESVPSYGSSIGLALMYSVVGLLFGLSLFLVLNSLSPVAARYYLPVTGTFWAAALIGIAAVFAPSGIGVREGVLMAVLPAFVPEPAVIVGAILIRLVLTGAELVTAGVSRVLSASSSARE